MLVAAESGRRNRRPLDAFVLAFAVLLLTLAAIVETSAPAHDADVAEALTTLLGWAPAVWRLVLVAALGLAAAILVAVVVRRRWALARDLVVVLLVAGAVAAVIGRLVESAWFVLDWGPADRSGFPDLRVAVVVAVISVAAPELVQPVRPLGRWLIMLAAIGVVVLGSTTPSSARRRPSPLGLASRRGGAPGVRLRRRRPAERDGRGGARGARRRGG